MANFLLLGAQAMELHVDVPSQCEGQGLLFCQRQCQIPELLWEMLHRLLQGMGSLTTHCVLCIFFHKKENLGCVSRLPASLEHAIFCPGRLETLCLGQKSVSVQLSG